MVAPERPGGDLESVLGATPHEFESLILRTRPPGQMRAPTGSRSGLS
jgi:hypothetical protein